MAVAIIIYYIIICLVVLVIKICIARKIQILFILSFVARLLWCSYLFALDRIPNISIVVVPTIESKMNSETVDSISDHS